MRCASDVHQQDPGSGGMALAPSFVEMNIMRFGISCLLVLLATRVFAHVGDEIYPFFELLDEDLERIDLTDGSVEDWLRGHRRALADGHRLLLGELSLRSLGIGLPHLARVAPGQQHRLDRHGALRRPLLQPLRRGRTQLDASLGFQHRLPGRRRPQRRDLRRLDRGRALLRGMHARECSSATTVRRSGGWRSPRRPMARSWTTTATASG